MFRKLNNYKPLILVILMLSFIFYFGGIDNFNLDIAQHQLANDLINNVESNSNLNLDPVIEESNSDPVTEDSINHKKYIYIACGVFVASLLIVGFFYYKGGDSGSSLSLGKNDFSNAESVVSSRYSGPEYSEYYIENSLINTETLSRQVDRVSQQINASANESGTSVNEGAMALINETREVVIPRLRGINNAAAAVNNAAAEAINNGAAAAAVNNAAAAVNNAAATAINNAAAGAINNAAVEAAVNNAADVAINNAAGAINSAVAEAVSNGAAAAINNVADVAINNAGDVAALAIENISSIGTFGGVLLGMLSTMVPDLSISVPEIIPELSPGPSPINGLIQQEVRNFLSNFPTNMHDIILTRGQYYYTNYFIGMCLPGIEDLLHSRFVNQHSGFLRFLVWPAEDVLEELLPISQPWLSNLINNSTGGTFFSNGNNRELCNMLMAYLGTTASLLIFKFKIYLVILLQGGYDIVASIIIDFSMWEEVILPDMSIEDIRSVISTIRTIFLTYEDTVIINGVDLNSYRIFLNIESEEVLIKMIKIRDTIASRAGTPHNNIIVNNMYLFVTILSDIMRELIKFR